MAAELDGKIELVAGAFSHSPERSREAGVGFGIDPARAYASYQEMMEAEQKRPDAIDFVVITTPNNLHLPVAVAALEAGFPVMSDKPATATYEEALKLEAAVAEVRAALRADAYLCRLRNGAGGASDLRQREAGKDSQGAMEYLQGWLSQAARDHGAQAGCVARRSCV